MTIIPRGIGDREVSPVALGSASWPFAEGRPELVDDLAIRAIHAALDVGISFLDTARAYTRGGENGTAECLIRRALDRRLEWPMIGTKGGHYRSGDSFPIDASPATVRRHCELSLELLGVDHLDLYQLHWPDPRLSMRAAMESFVALKEEGLIRAVGLSNVSVAQLEQARAVIDIVSVQNHFSPFDQSDRPMLDHCGEQRIAYLAYSPLGGKAAFGLAQRFPRAARVAMELEVSVQQLALSWLLHQSPMLIAIAGASRPETVVDAAGAMHLHFGAAELDEMDFGDSEETAA